MKRALLIVSTVLAGCTAGFNYTKTSGEVTKAKPANCNFRVVSVVPTEVRVVEIGVLEFDRGGFGITDMSEFREAIAAQVCEAGGDIVVAQVNGAGMYMRGVVLRLLPPPPAPAPIAPPPVAPAPPPSGAPIQPY